jgi:hypothetical protein
MWIEDTAGSPTRTLALLRPVWVTATTDEPRSIPDLNHVMFASLVLGYINSFAVGQAFNLLALGTVLLLVQPKNAISGHGPLR